MQLLKALFVALFTVVAVVAGAVAAAVVAAVGLLVFSLRRLLHGQKISRPPTPAQGRPYRRQPRKDDADVIEVTATEVNR
jgi:hypothetical protein